MQNGKTPNSRAGVGTTELTSREKFITRADLIRPNSTNEKQKKIPIKIKFHNLEAGDVSRKTCKNFGKFSFYETEILMNRYHRHIDQLLQTNRSETGNQKLVPDWEFQVQRRERPNETSKLRVQNTGAQVACARAGTPGGENEVQDSKKDGASFFYFTKVSARKETEVNIEQPQPQPRRLSGTRKRPDRLNLKEGGNVSYIRQVWRY